MNMHNAYQDAHQDRLEDAGIEVNQAENRLSVQVAKHAHQQQQYQSPVGKQSPAINDNHQKKSQSRLRFVATTILRLLGIG